MKKKLYEVVKDLLEKKPFLRDSDKNLIWELYISEGFIKNDSITKEDFLNAPHMESIRRVRQKIQEEHPELQSSPEVLEAKKKKEKKKGNFVFEEELIDKKKGHWDTSTGVARWVED